MHIHWMFLILTEPAIPHLPRLRRIGYETVGETSYIRSCGGHRSSSHTLIAWTESGLGAIRDESGVHEMSPGQAFLTRINDPSVCYFFPRASRQWTFCYAALEIDPRLSDELTAQCGRVISVDPQPWQQLLSWAASYKTSPTLNAAESHSWATRLLGQWAAAARLEPPVDALITAAKDRIASNLISGISVDILAPSYRSAVLISAGGFVPLLARLSVIGFVKNVCVWQEIYCRIRIAPLPRWLVIWVTRPQVIFRAAIAKFTIPHLRPTERYNSNYYIL